MSKQITMDEWVARLERLAGAVGTDLVKAKIFNNGRSLSLEGFRVCAAHVALRSDEDDPEGLRYFPMVEMVRGTALCGDLDEVSAAVRIYAAVCGAARACRDLLDGLVVVRQK